MKTRATILCAVVALLFSTSCLNGGSSSGGSSSATDVGYYTSYTIEEDGTMIPVYTNETQSSVNLYIPDILVPSMNVTLYGVRFTEKMPPQTISFIGLAFTKVIADDGINYVINTGDIVPKVSDVEFPDYKVKSLKVSVGTKVVVDMEFEALPYRLIFHSEAWNNTPMVYAGSFKTIRTATSSEEVTFESNTAEVKVEKKIKGDVKCLSVTFNGVQFAAAMPALNITFPELPFKRTVNTNGIVYTIDAENIVPKIGDVEYPNYKAAYINALLHGEADVEFSLATMPYKVIFTTSVNQ